MPERQGLLALTGTVAPLLTVPTHLLQMIDQHSIWVPRMWKKTTPFVIDDTTLQPCTQQAFNAEMMFDIPKQAHLIKSIILHIVLPSHTVVPAGTARLVDHFGFAAIEYLRTMFGANLCYETQAYDLYFRYRKELEMEQRDCVNDMVGGDRTFGQLTTDLANGTEFFVPLFQPYDAHPSMAKPLLTLSQKLRLILKTPAFQNLVVANAGTTVTANAAPQFELIMKEVHLTSHEAAKILNMSRADKGITYMIHQHVRQNSDNIANTANGHIANIRMAGITKPIKTLYWALIGEKLMNNTGRNDQFFFAHTPVLGPVPAGFTPYSPIQSWSIQANGQIIQRTILRNYDRLVNHFRYLKSPHGEDIYHQFYNEYPCSFSAAIGYNDYTNYSNPVLTITFGNGGTGTDPDNPLVGQVLRLIINAQDYNFWYFQNGNFTRTFN